MPRSLAPPRPYALPKPQKKAPKVKPTSINPFEIEEPPTHVKIDKDGHLKFLTPEVIFNPSKYKVKLRVIDQEADSYTRKITKELEKRLTPSGNILGDSHIASDNDDFQSEVSRLENSARK